MSVPSSEPPASGGSGIEAPLHGETESQWLKAMDDLRDGAMEWRLWGTIAWQDLRNQYRRSVIGPFWMTLSMAILVIILGLIWSKLLGSQRGQYMPYIALGFITWQLIQNMVQVGCKVFIAEREVIRQLPGPLSIHVFGLVWQQLIIFGHNIWVYVGVAIVYSIWPGMTALLALPGLFLVCINVFWMALLLGLISSRFRDIPQFIQSFIRPLFYLTPIIWSPDMLPGRAIFVDINPLYHLIEMVRSPLLGEVPAMQSYVFVLAIAVIGWAVTFVVFMRYRWRIAYWV